MTLTLQPLDKRPVSEPTQDFYGLRREGISLIQRAGSMRWTDYNVHDPGITILEVLCYGITDLGYRLGWRIEDLLMPQTPSSDPQAPYPKQAFFTAREILTVNPTSADDLRRMLIDLPSVRDAWITCKQCACDVAYWASCDLEGKLRLQYDTPAATQQPVLTWAKGLYEALLELEEHPLLGDLNDRKLEYSAVYHDANGTYPILVELRFPDPSLGDRAAWSRFLDDPPFADPAGFTTELRHLGATKDFNALDLPTEDKQRQYVQDQWNGVFYLGVRLVPKDASPSVDIAYVALRVFAGSVVRNAFQVNGWKAFVGTTAAELLVLYRSKLRARRDAVSSARAALHAQRNLDEDYCAISCVGIEEVAFCADVDVSPAADIERVQAEIWFEIERYLNPPVPFRTLQELRDAGQRVEDIFDGPALDNGFIQDEDLRAASLRTMLRGSDVIDRLMNIDGVNAVRQLRMTKYDADGNVVSGVADPTWVDGQPVYDSAKKSAAWLLAISSRHQPRLYRSQSRFLFFKNGLPFRPRADEANDTLTQLRGDAERPKNPNAPKDLPVPPGHFRDPASYQPLQYSLPLCYGIGREGLPANATPLRRAQAKDLKAYLMVFEQLLANASAQVAHTAELFSLDPKVDRTYFTHPFAETELVGFSQIATSDLKPEALQALVETRAGFLARRNGFLDHLLARFGEQFGEYALLLTDVEGRAVAPQRLIEDKIAFLNAYPRLSHDRGRGFDYTKAPAAAANQPGLKQRVSLLLGFPDLAFVWTLSSSVAGSFDAEYVLQDGHSKPWLRGKLTVAASDATAAEQAAYRTLLARMILRDAYTSGAAADGSYEVRLRDAALAEIGHADQPLPDVGAAGAFQDALLAWSANARSMLVEHLLLRPKFVGDALYPVCSDGSCHTCGNQDPYSFRLTYVMPGWTARYTGNLELRRFADRTIQEQTPSHLLTKTCWVGNDGLTEDPCDGIVDELAGMLLGQATPVPSPDQACTDAKRIYQLFHDEFAGWYADKKLAFLRESALRTWVEALLRPVPMPSAGALSTAMTAALWAALCARMITYFVDVALRGWQFERFEWAWYSWLEANAALDWSAERLRERIEVILGSHVTSAASASALCACAEAILVDYGTQFYAWMFSNVEAGKTLDELGAPPVPTVVLSPNLTFANGTKELVAALLAERYALYAKPSYWLWAVVIMLSNLHNVYPGATLHDCDDGSDQNPVRLDSTALGSVRRRTTL